MTHVAETIGYLDSNKKVFLNDKKSINADIKEIYNNIVVLKKSIEDKLITDKDHIDLVEMMTYYLSYLYDALSATSVRRGGFYFLMKETLWNNALMKQKFPEKKIEFQDAINTLQQLVNRQSPSV
jgi:hypothetical protein